MAITSPVFIPFINLQGSKNYIIVIHNKKKQKIICKNKLLRKGDIVNVLIYERTVSIEGKIKNPLIMSFFAFIFGLNKELENNNEVKNSELIY